MTSARDRRGPRKVGLWPLVFTVFIGFVFLDPFERHASRLEWTVTVLGVAAFIGLYAVALLYSDRRAVALGAIAGVSVLGFAFAPFNAGAALFIIFATSFAPYAVGGEIRPSVTVIGLIILVVASESWLLHLHWIFLAYSAGYALVLGTGNIYAARQAFAAERLAKADERERIARDLHDILGHTLSLIILKAELAGRLLDNDLDRARAEIGDLEAISRQALAEVRQTISGYLSGGLQAELERARSTLETAGLTVQSRSAGVAMTPAQEQVLVLVLREAVTNVVRHAGAKTCRLRAETVDGGYRLEVADDGRGAWHVEGHGVRGMRERIEALGGTLTRQVDTGTTLTVTLPLPRQAQGEPG
jgi:two-component system, NarL family, sensor histidine kinase DesK